MTKAGERLINAAQSALDEFRREGGKPLEQMEAEMTDTPNKIEEIRAALEGATPGPWRWELNLRAKTINLVGANGDLTVMDFVRWGMSGAVARFWRWSGRPRIGDPKRADELATPFPGREHHADWCSDIDDPNACLIALAPDMARIVLAAAEMAETHKAMLRMLDDTMKGTGHGDMAISPDHSLTLVEAWKRDAAYRKAVEGGE